MLNQQPDPPAPTSGGAVSFASPGQASRERAASTSPANFDEPAETAAPTARSTEGSEPLSPGPAEPTRVRIDSIDVTSKLHPLGLTPEGALEVPTGQLYNQAAWYEGSPTPGEVGPAVIQGHVTSQGSVVPSVFFDLGAVTVGDRIEVDRNDRSTAVFEVYKTDSFPKDAFPSLAVYGRTTEAELRVITCGGDYNSTERRHIDNVVVFARLVDAA